MKSWVDIALPGGYGERHRLPDAGASVGSSSSADIAIRAASGLLPIHGHLRPQPEGCWVELHESAPDPFTVDGQPSRGCLVPWGQDIFLGSVRLTVASEGAGRRKGPSPLVWLAALVVPLVAASFVFQPDRSVAGAHTRELEPPPLFGALPPCSAEAEGALGRGAVAEQIARAKHERGVFELSDRVSGIQLMREAAVCYALGGNQGASDRVLDVAERWMGDLQFNYKRALLDLELGQRQHNPKRVLDAIGRLGTLLRHAPPDAAPFNKWVAQVRRDQMAVVAEQAKKKKKGK